MEIATTTPGLEFARIIIAESVKVYEGRTNGWEIPEAVDYSRDPDSLCAVVRRGGALVEVMGHLENPGVVTGEGVFEEIVVSHATRGTNGWGRVELTDTEFEALASRLLATVEASA